MLYFTENFVRTSIRRNQSKFVVFLINRKYSLAWRMLVCQVTPLILLKLLFNNIKKILNQIFCAFEDFKIDRENQVERDLVNVLDH